MSGSVAPVSSPSPRSSPRLRCSTACTCAHQTGLSQKAGRADDDLRITTGAPAPSNLIGDEGADVIIAFDLLGAASPACSAGDPTRTVLIDSSDETPTGR